MRCFPAAALAVAVVCVFAPAAFAADASTAAAAVFVSPSGSDTRDCRSPTTACKSFNRAYQVAQLGQVVEVAGGVYPGQLLSGGAKSPQLATAPAVVFRPALGASVVTGPVEINVPHLRFENMRFDKWKARYDVRSPSSYAAGDLSLRNVDTRHFSLNAVQNVTVADSDVGPNRNPTTGDWPQDGIYVGAYPPDKHVPTNIVFDNLNVHDIREPNADAHSDCVQFTAGVNVTVRNSRFEDCEHADLMIKGDQGPIDGFLVENNFLDKTLAAYYSINLYETSRGCRNVVMRHNTALQNVRADACSGGSLTGTIQPSMSSSTCSKATVKLNWNVYESGGKCGSNDRVADVKFVDQAAFDLHLAPGSPGIDQGNPNAYPSDDIDSEARTTANAPDIGADELRGSSSPATEPTPEPEPTEPTPTPTPTPDTSVTLLKGACPDRSSPNALAGLTISGKACLFAAVAETASQVSFWLDENPDSSPWRTERTAPWDFNGDTTSGPRAWDTSTVADGAHRITAEATLSDGRKQRVEAKFTVDN
jgi:hypothetical protein